MRKILFVLLLFLIASTAGVGFFVFQSFSQSIFPALQGIHTASKDTAGMQQQNRAVLGNATQKPKGKLSFNLPVFFNDTVTFKKAITVDDLATFNGKAIFNNDVQMTNHNLDLGTGQLTASNVVYAITAGPGITVSPGQTPTITNSGVLSLQGQTGDIKFSEGTGIKFDGLKINNTGVTSVQGQAGAVTFTVGDGLSMSGTTISQTIATGLTTNGVVYANGGSTLASLTPGTTGYVLQSNGTGTPPSWVAQSSVVAGSVAFNNITSGTNTTAAMIVGSGASLNFSGTGTINASTLNGNTFAAPSAIGSTTPNTGAFTTLTGTTVNGLTITNTGSNTLTIASGKTFTVNNTLTLAGTDSTSKG